MAVASACRQDHPLSWRKSKSGLSVDDDPGPGNYLSVGLWKFRPEIIFHIRDHRNDAFSTWGISDRFVRARQGLAQIDTADARQEIVTGMNQNFVTCAGVFEFETRLRFGIWIFRAGVVECSV